MVGFEFQRQLGIRSAISRESLTVPGISSVQIMRNVARAKLASHISVGDSSFLRPSLGDGRSVSASNQHRARQRDGSTRFDPLGHALDSCSGS